MLQSFGISSKGVTSMKKLFFVLILLTQLSFAQTDTVKSTLNEIVVSANKTQTPYYSLASTVSVISEKEIKEKNYNSVIDILREVPGISVFQLGGPGMLSYVNIRGANTNHTLVLVDGTEMNDASSPSNAFDFSTLSVNDISKIEIVRGPQSTLYGSDAIAGVIAIYTKEGQAKQKFSINGETGSNNFYKGIFSAAGSLNNLNYFFSAYRMSSKGISSSNSLNGNNETDGFTNNGITGRINYLLSNSMSIDLLYKFKKFNSDLDQNEKFGDDPNFTYRTEEQIFKSGLKINLLDNRWQQFVNVSLVKKFGATVDLPDSKHPKTSSDNLANAQRIKIDWQNNIYLFDNHLITFGAETETEKANTSYYSTSDWGPYVSIFPEQTSRTTGIFLQDQINVGNSFFTSIGIRYDKHNKFGGINTFRIAPAYYFASTNSKIRASYGTGFKTPSLFYLYDPLFGNPDLKPEKSIGWDFGFDQFLMDGKISLGITYFGLKLENMFGFDENYKTINIAKASSRGMEFTASLNNLNGFSVNTNYTLNSTKDEYDKSEDFDKQLLRRPKHQFSLTVGYEINSDVKVFTSIKYQGTRDDKDFSAFPAQRITMPDYTIVGVSASYKLFENLSLNARVENLFDKKYEEVLFYGTLGRSFYVGLNFDF